MPFTYTYTARNQENPNRVLTFTIFENYLKVNLTGLVDQVSDVVKEEDRESAVKDFLTTQTGTTLYKVLERLSGPVHVSDVHSGLDEGALRLIFWKRVAGLRFAPIVLSLGKVDNPEATEQFVETIQDRQNLADKPGKFTGPLDYWGTWIGLTIALIVLLRWPRKKKA